MAISLDSISRGKSRLSPRVVLVGVEKIGKSQWAAGAPSPIFLPIRGEQGLDEIESPKFPTIESFEGLMESLRALAEGAHGYRTVVIDSMSTLEPLVWDAVCKRHSVIGIENVLKGYGKGYIEALKEWRELQSALDFLRESRLMGSVLIGHSKVKTFNDPLADPYDQYQIDLQKDASNLWMRWADAILFANYKVYAKTVAAGAGDKKTVHATGGSERALFTEKRPGHPGGNRYSLPYELKLSYADFAAAMAKTGSGDAAA